MEHLAALTTGGFGLYKKMRRHQLGEYRNEFRKRPGPANRHRGISWENRMTEAEYVRKLEELDRQLNDPDIPMDPARVWALLADLSEHASGSDVAFSGALPSNRAASDTSVTNAVAAETM